jgi:hypothetical protein
MPETPAPSSRIVEVGLRREEVKRKFVGEVSQVAKRGVTFHTTVGGVLVRLKYRICEQDVGQ